MATSEMKGTAPGTRPEPESHVAEVLARTDIPVEHMPPLTTTPKEHEIPAAERLPETPSLTTRLNRQIAWVLAGLSLVLLGFVAYGFLGTTTTATPTEARMGLSPAAWTDYRAGERALIGTPLHMGLSTAAWADYRAGEQASPTTATLHMGLSPSEWLAYRAGEQASILTPVSALPHAYRGWTATTA